jgi:hypothetical protein
LDAYRNLSAPVLGGLKNVKVRSKLASVISTILRELYDFKPIQSKVPAHLRIHLYDELAYSVIDPSMIRYVEDWGDSATSN